MNTVDHGPLLTLLPIKTMADLLNIPVNKNDNVTLVDALDKVLEKGAVISGDIAISVADVDLVFLGLRLILTSVSKAEELSGKSFSNRNREITPEDIEYVKRLQRLRSRLLPKQKRNASVVSLVVKQMLFLQDTMLKRKVSKRY